MLLIFEGTVQSLLNVCVYDVFSLMLTKPQVNRTRDVIERNKSLETHLLYNLCFFGKTWIRGGKKEKKKGKINK